MKLLRGLLAGCLATVAVVEYLFWGMGPGGVGKTIFFLLLLGSYYLAVGTPVGTARDKVEHFALVFAVVALSASYSFYDNKGLQFWNFAVNLFLLGILFLQGVMGDTFRWDSGIFQLEHAISYFVRPFLCIHRPWVELAAAGKNGNKENRKKHIFTFLYIFLAFLIGIPLLLILSSLLFDADPVFASVLKPLVDAFSSFHFENIIGKGALFLFLVPFVLSTIWSYRDKLFVLQGASKAGSDNKRIPAAFAITILVMVNGLYLLYALVQFQYLFSAGSGVLPGNLSYAEYARSGFFELAFIALINIFLMIFSVRFTTRNGATGLVIRLMNIVLMALSVVQLVSAFLRMGLYIQVYGLSMLRYFVTAFMILAAVWFLLVLLREFIPKFPLFKSFVFTGALALVLLNYSVPDYQIANYNTQKYLSGDIEDYDAVYMSSELSASGHLVMLDFEDELLEKDPSLRSFFSLLKKPPFRSEYRDNTDNYKLFIYCDAQLNEKILQEQTQEDS